MIATEVEVEIEYGLGAKCTGRFPRTVVEGLPVKEVIAQVAGQEQRTDDARRAARVVQNALRGTEPIDLELPPATGAPETLGKPLTMDDILVPKGVGAEDASRIRQLAIRMSESYRGGRR
jgi:hypothetical protein